MEDIAGINKQEMRNFVNKMNLKNSQFCQMFDRMSDLINDTNSCVGEEMGESIRTNFQKISRKFDSFKQALNVYCTELNNVESNFDQLELRVEATILNNANNMK